MAPNQIRWRLGVGTGTGKQDSESLKSLNTPSKVHLHSWKECAKMCTFSGVKALGHYPQQDIFAPYFSLKQGCQTHFPEGHSPAQFRSNPN